MPSYMKARKHHGSSSLDLTIPAEIVKKAKISIGDLFLVEFESNKDEVTLTYKRIFKA